MVFTSGAESTLMPGRSYWLKCGAQILNASITKIKHQVNVNTLENIAADKLEVNAVAECNFFTDKPLVFDSYSDNPGSGGFVLIDRISNLTVAAGIVEHPLRRSQNVQPQHFQINKESRSRLNNQKPCVLWFTGLSGSGKSSIANELEKKLFEMGHRTYVLDGDNVRHGLCKDLGFTEEGRVENVRRVAEVSKLMIDAGLIVLATLISPYRADRKMARTLFADGEFFEIFVDTPLEICEARDSKGLYRKARKGEIKNFTGIDSQYEKPDSPDLRILSDNDSMSTNIRKLLELLGY
jgi:bifunctional enzyme CysN/CysC